jgi:hypothetical protein
MKKKDCKECSYTTGKGSNYHDCFVKNPEKCPAHPAYKMPSVAIEDIMLANILAFCENAAELGCPPRAEVDMWIRNLADRDLKAARKVMGKLLDIMDKEYEKNEKSNTKR